MKPLHCKPDNRRFQALIGTGGIGSGMFFTLDGNCTLGREESRSGRFLEQRDYCKLHIICHYLKVLLGRNFPVIPVSKVGEDEVGRKLLAEMKETGLDLRFVQTDPDRPTMFSMCFLYPDGSGGNLTAANSACGQLEADFIWTAGPAFKQYAGCGLALAVPEVPLLTRKMFLEIAREQYFFTAASFTSVEITPALEMDLLSQVDLLSINLDEAATLVHRSVSEGSVQSILSAAFDRFQNIHPGMSVMITGGKRGSWCNDGGQVHAQPALPVRVVSTAGAGDAFLAGVLCGITVGLTLPQSQELGTLVAGCSVTSPHTIHPALDRDLLAGLAVEFKPQLSKQVLDLVGIANVST
jgi:ribokinase